MKDGSAAKESGEELSHSKDGLLLFGHFFRHRGLGGGEAGDRYAEG
jgi:hypothetical protein